MLILVGCNHRSAPVAFRERLAFAPGEIPRAIDVLLEPGQIDEAVILSTCNRVEVLVRVDDSNRAVEAVKGLLGAARNVSREQIDRYTYHFIGRDAARHLFRVGAGLDSMILGEPQILGQVKRAYLVAKGHGATGPVLDRLLQQGLAAAKRIRTETGISRNAVSVASAAVNLARQIFGELVGRKALLIGSGKMTQLVAKHLVSHGVTEVWVTSRTYDQALTLAEKCAGTAVHWDEGFSRLSAVDIVVSCTGSPRTILSPKTVVDALYKRRGEPLFIIDIRAGTLRIGTCQLGAGRMAGRRHHDAAFRNSPGQQFCSRHAKLGRPVPRRPGRRPESFGIAAYCGPLVQHGRLWPDGSSGHLWKRRSRADRRPGLEEL